MNGPSIDAIRRFKEQQEKKKQEENEKKIRDKLATLEHRASQGDRKAKQELKKIEKIKEERSKPPEDQKVIAYTRAQPSIHEHVQPQKSNSHLSSKARRTETDFDELMRLAKQNKNEVIKPEPPKPKSPPPASKSKQGPSHAKVRPNSGPVLLNSQKEDRTKSFSKTKSKPVVESSIKLPLATASRPTRPDKEPIVSSAIRRGPLTSSISSVARPAPPRVPYRYHSAYKHVDDDDEEEDEDDYEEDDFVVDEEDLDVQDEVSRTISSLFKYDKKRCDLREAALDREYRAIGRVSTYEDLEREERRASRLAAAEDAKAQREEEERKRLKKIRLRKSK